MTNVDKKFVTASLLKVATPILEACWFQRKKGVGITFRRAGEFRTDVFEFEIFGPSKCAEWNIPPYSFTVNAGVFYKFVPSFCDDEMAENPEGHPQEFECHFRMHVVKGIWQWRCKDENFWCVHKDGKNIDRIVMDIERLLRKDVLPWYEQFENVDGVYADLIGSKNENNKYKKFLKKYGISFGVSLQIPAFLAFHLKKNESLELAKEALASSLFDENYPKIQHVKTALEGLCATYAFREDAGRIGHGA